MSSKKRNTELVKLAQTYHVAKSDTDTSIFDFLSALDCPKSLAVWLLYTNGEHQQLVDLDIDPLDYNDPWGFRDAYAAYCFLSKADFFKLAVSKKQAAYKKFFQYEELCKQTNNRFRNLALDPNYHGSNVWLLNATIRKIADILGDYAPEEFVELADWGPGVTTLLKGEHVSAVNKFHCENGITRDLYSLVGDWFPLAYPRWNEHLTLKFGESCFNPQVGNSIVTVPKNSKTDRVIAVEPGINLWFQKSIGSMIRRRLQRRGVDLNHQDRNQALSRLASKTGHLATIDFSSASDSISRELVREVIPPDWFKLLNACRTPLGRHENSIIRWEKFSSMGNGFTFELESLIFFAAALATCDMLGLNSAEVSVYGDDVIIPVEAYDLFSSFSAFLGFKVNNDKSFGSSYFRESCGVHWFDGIDCKPIFLKERLRNVQSVYKLANSVRALAHRRNSYCGCDSRFRGTWYHLLKRVPRPLRLWTSLGLGDTGFIGNFDEATPVRASHGIEGYHVSLLVESGVNQNFEEAGLLLARLKGLGNGSGKITYLRKNRAGALTSEPLLTLAYGNSYTLRGRVKVRLVRALVAQWYNLGPWV